MFKWFKRRFSEPSSYAGLGVAAVGISQTFGVGSQKAQMAAEAAGQVGQVVASGGSPLVGLLMVGMGALATVLKDKGGE